MNKYFDNDMLGNKAVERFNNSYNCAQSVISVYTKFLKIDKDTALNISSGFGAGMGRLQKTCGAVTAAYMVFGLLSSQENLDIGSKKAKTYSMIQKFHQNFIKIHKTTDCKDLINCDLNTEEGQACFKNENLKKEVCEICIRDSIKLINEAFDDNTSDQQE